MRTKQLTALFLLIVMLFSLLAGCAQPAEPPEPPEWMKEFYKPNKRDQPYARGVPLHEMDFGEYWRYFKEIGDDLMEDNAPETVVLPCDVEYFLHKEDKTPAVVLKEGTEVSIVKNNLPITLQNAFHMSGYGLQTWPDYEAGWRYGIPFRTRLNEVEALAGAKRYYVKTEQLFEVANAYLAVLDEQDPFDESLYEDEPEWLEYEKAVRERRPAELVLSVDGFLALKGAFLSPDYIKYYKPYPDRPD